MVNLILTLDYEIFGNGSGDVVRDIIEPTDRLLDICDEHGAKLSLMFEVAEYWAFRAAEENALLQLDYNPTELMEQQVRRAVERGHDVQLHIHTQWIGAEFKEGRWQVKSEQLSLLDLPEGLCAFEDESPISKVLTEGKKTLEGILKVVDPGYECLVFRARELCLEPSAEIIRAFKTAGLVADSSVVYGLYSQVPERNIDYRKAESNYGYWWTDYKDVQRKGASGENILEFPVCSFMKPYIANFKWTKFYTTLKRRSIQSSGNNQNFKSVSSKHAQKRSLIKELFRSYPLKLDFCKLSAADMCKFLDKIIRNNSSTSGDIVPVVMIGHSKDFWNDRNLKTFLYRVREEYIDKGQVTFTTLGETVRSILKLQELSLSIA